MVAIEQEGDAVKKEYDFSAGRRNPYAKRLTRPVRIRLDAATRAYFATIARKTGVPAGTLIGLMLRDCATSGRRLSMSWTTPPRPRHRPSK